MTRLPIFMRPAATSGTGRPPEWSREQITVAAVAVADADGPSAVTMRRVATELGTVAASLDRHLETRDDLLDLMIDAALSEYEPPPVTGAWREDVVADHLARLRFLRRRRWLVDAIATRPAFGPQGMRLAELTLARLGGHPARQRWRRWARWPGCCRPTPSTRVGAGCWRRSSWSRRCSSCSVRWPVGSTRTLAAALSAPPPSEPEPQDDRLARILAMVLDGLLPE